MEALVQRVALHEALELVFVALDTKAGPKGHTSILFSEVSGKLRITGFSADTIVSAYVVPVEITAGLALALPSKPLKEILRKIDGESVKLRLHEHKTSLHSGRATFKFNNLTSDHFPRIPTLSVSSWHEVAIPKVLKGFQKVSFSISNDENYSNLKVIHIDEKNFTASDSFRMAIYENSDLRLGAAISLSRIAAGKIVKLLKKMSGNCRVGVDDTMFVLESGQATVVSRVSAFKYPNYRSVIPSNEAVHAVFDKDDLEGAIQRLLIVAGESAVIEISIKNDIATFNTFAEGQVGQEFLECEYHGNVRLKINGRYLLDVIERLEKPQVSIDIRPDKQTASGPMPYPIVIKEENYVNLIMPRRC